jgi:hypothetical protein
MGNIKLRIFFREAGAHHAKHAIDNENLCTPARCSTPTCVSLSIPHNLPKGSASCRDALGVPRPETPAAPRKICRERWSQAPSGIRTLSGTYSREHSSRHSTCDTRDALRSGSIQAVRQQPALPLAICQLLCYKITSFSNVCQFW